jgi:phosphoserine phosphatase RsbU/P
MFVSVVCGILCFKTGELRYANAGHNPPLILDATHRTRWLELPPGYFLGVFEDSSYETRSIELHAGDTLFLYTDGVTEAMNPEKALFSEERLVQVLEESRTTSVDTLVREVTQAVKHYAGDEPQSDDITILALHFKGSEKDF